MTETPDQPPRPRSALGPPLRSLGLFGAGIAAALLALLLYRGLFPPTPSLTQEDVANSIAAVMASATPPAAFSADVYAIIRPSLVLIESQGPGGEDDGRLGSGVIVDANGSILTSLHVVTNSVGIKVTFADGTEFGGDCGSGATGKRHCGAGDRKAAGAGGAGSAGQPARAAHWG